MKIKYLALGFLGLSLATFNAHACTHFRVTAEDKSVVVGRSMEFAPNLETEIYQVKRAKTFTSQTPDGKPGLAWKNQYGYLALNGFHLFPVSGVNEKGLSFDALYLPGLAQYQTYQPDKAAKALPYYLIADYLLGNFDSVAAVKEKLPSISLYDKPLKHENKDVTFPLHFVVTDKSGHGLIIEYVDGELHLYDDKVGVLTNSPSYPWHMANLNNYVQLSPNSPSPIIKDGVTYAATGQGAGALGLPGDYSPPSRFVKIAYLLNTAKPVSDAKAAVNLSQHLLNTVDIPRGAVRGTKGTADENQIDYTQWVVIKDLTHQTIYFRTYDNLELQKIDLERGL